MFEFSVTKNMKKNNNNDDNRRIPTYLLTLNIKELKTSVKQGKMVTTLNKMRRC